MAAPTKWDQTAVGREGVPSFTRETIEKLESHLASFEEVTERIAASAPQVLLLGEGSHGSHEYYANRNELTLSMIERGLCDAVLIEGDLPDTAKLHRFVMGHPSAAETSVDGAFLGFERFPTWMWANADMRAFVLALKARNSELPMDKRCGVFGLDLYSLNLSIAQVLDYLSRHDKEMERLVRRDYAVMGELDPQTYGMLAQRGLIQGCREAAVRALKNISAKTPRYAAQDCQAIDTETDATEPPLDPISAQDDAFINEMNAQVIVGAEEYYRGMFDPTVSSWNLRDQHFYLALARVRQHLASTRGRSRVAVWAHNSHLGDARFTHLERLRGRELNLGQLVRERDLASSLSVGQLCHSGLVTAADDWGEPHRFKPIVPGLSGSHEDLFHALALKSGRARFGLDLGAAEVAGLLGGNPRLERAIGVIYRPETERQSHYFSCDLPNQFNWVWFEDTTTPVIPLVEEEFPSKEPETFPTGL